MSLFSGKNKCHKFFTYESRELNIKGLTANLEKSQIGDLLAGLGEISIVPKNVEATNKLKELDLLQFSICKDIQQLDKNDPNKAGLLKRIIETKIEMLRIAQNPESVKKK